jgi:ribosome-associated translation inhibitor RaiA
MQLPLQITFHHMPKSEALEEVIRERAGKLAQVYDRMIGCRVVVDAPHRNQQKGRSYEVRIDISVPGSEIVITREPRPECLAAVNDAFEVARRRLMDFAKKRKAKEYTPPLA